MELPNRFNVRVYGLLVHDGKLLVAEETIYGKWVNKFPGGGLEFGEGIHNCLVREFLEETNLAITVGEHFYTNTFFQRSAFNPHDQLLSHYYWVTCADISPLDTTQPSVNPENGEQIRWHWYAIKDIHPDMFALPVDRVVVEMLGAIK